MKFKFLSVLVLAVIFSSVMAFKNSDSSTKQEEPFKIMVDKTEVEWTAYKTTDKIAVSGIFEEIIIENAKEASSIFDALNGLKFKIPISSINSFSLPRDETLRTSFFGKMINTSHLSGYIQLTDNTNGHVILSMNGVSHKLPISYSISKRKVTIEGVMDVDNWKAQAAIKALNEVCEGLHTGSDGITKTWSEVKIKVKTRF